MSTLLFETATANTAEFVQQLPSGLAIGRSEQGQLLQLLWQPRQDEAGRTYEITRDGTTYTNLMYKYETTVGARTIVRNQDGETINPYVSMGTIKRHNTVHHFAALNYAGNDLLHALVFKSGLGEKSPLLNPSEASRQLGRYACGLTSLPIGDIHRQGVDSNGVLQLLARRPGLDFSITGGLWASPFRASVSILLANDELANGVAICVDEYTAEKAAQRPIRLYRDAKETASRYKALLGPAIDGVVKAIRPQGREDIVLFADVD